MYLGVALGALLVLWLLFIAALYRTGRRAEARAVAGFVPDCLTLVRGLLADRRVRRVDKALLVALLGYLVLPFDLVPDFVPVAGQLDDVVIAAWVLRRVVRRAGDEVIRENWRGPEASLRLILRLAGAPRASTGCRE